MKLWPGLMSLERAAIPNAEEIMEVRISQPTECCAAGWPHVHKKADGLLFVNRGKVRFLTLWETLLYRLFERLPKE